MTQNHNHCDSASFSVGMIRLELTTTRPPDVYANQLRYIPISPEKRHNRTAFLKTCAKVHIFFEICK